MAKAKDATTQNTPATASNAATEEVDELYEKAKAEKNGFTLIHKDKVEKNHTVKRVSDKVYADDMVIAERL